MKHEIDYTYNITLKDGKQYPIEGVQLSDYTLPYDEVIKDLTHKMKLFLIKKNIDYFKVKEITMKLKFNEN